MLNYKIITLKMCYFINGPSTVLDCILFLMVLCESDIRKMTFDEMFEEIAKRNWCNGTLTHETLGKVLSENEKMFKIVDGVYSLNDCGLSEAMKVNYE